MITDMKLKNKMDYIQRMCKDLSRDQNKLLNNIIYITKNALPHQLIIYDPNNIIVCIIQLYFYYYDILLRTDNICIYKRRKRYRHARECYNNLLKIYIPKKSRETLEIILDTICENKLWEFETFCFELICDLLKYGLSGSLMFHAMWDKIEGPNMNIEDSKRVMRILYELLNVYEWPNTHDTIIVIERILNLFYISITTTESTINFIPYATLKKSLEVCIINMVKHIYNYHLLIIIHHMCSWVVETEMTDEFILQFGSTLEYIAFIHNVTLYEKTLTPKIFPLLMEMIASTSKISSLLGNRVIQHLLDRKENKANFDTPKIFFEDANFDIKMERYYKEDKLFCKYHREILHDSFLKGILNHCTSRMNLESIYCTICLIAVEVPCGFTAAAVVCLLMNLQDITLKGQNKRHVEISYHIHATVIAIMSLLCWIHKADVFYEYVNKIMLERAQWAPHLNPPIQSQYNFAAHHILWNKPDLFFVDWEARYGLWKCFRLRETDAEQEIDAD
ncbi:uncharacterized protein LOC107999403 [Apis cerana]|uniref:uncharacterized protein LOC107999403 n=1 Tax=Apis cerana TaxID=7461 RepID=UPI0007E2BF18|nr:uncharacterized protein LOC107999403 [Apis cerana]